VGIGSNKHVVGLDAMISLFSSSCPIVVKRFSCSRGAIKAQGKIDFSVHHHPLNLPNPKLKLMRA